MSDWEFILPVTVTMPRKTKKDKVIPINLNWYRNAHHRESNDVKKAYKELIKPQFDSIVIPSGKIHVHYEFYAARNNHPDLDNFVSCGRKFFQDAMTELGFIVDDNIDYIPSSSDKYMGVDKNNPRIVAKITELQQ